MLFKHNIESSNEAMFKLLYHFPTEVKKNAYFFKPEKFGNLETVNESYALNQLIVL